MRGARTLEVLEVLGELEHVLDLLGGEVEQAQEAATGEVDAHVGSFHIEYRDMVENTKAKHSHTSRKDAARRATGAPHIEV